MNTRNTILTVSRFVAAIVMLQTLYFKFSGAEESIYIFTQVGMEPWGRIGTGIMELIASALLLYKSKSWIGALLGISLMSGAVVLHFTMLGIEVQGDGGYLFALALLVLGCSGLVLILQRQEATQQFKKWFIER